MTWKEVGEVTAVLRDVAVLLGAVFAVVKLRLFSVLSYRWSSGLRCEHVELHGSVMFLADYTVSNTGQRPIRLKSVTLRLTGVRTDGPLLWPDDKNVLAERIVRPDDPGMRGNLDVQPGERTTFTLRCRLSNLGDAVFVVCTVETEHKRIPAIYRSLYVKGASRLPPIGAP
jgi:hypothetical protein